MRKPILLTVAGLLVWCGAVRSADSPDKTLATNLMDVARNGSSPRVRAAALDALGLLGGARDVVGDLKDLLDMEQKKDGPDRDFIVFHVAGLGGIGYDARPAVPALLKAKGADHVLNQGIDLAAETILLAPAPVAPAAPPAPPVQSVEELIKQLSDPDEVKRLAAVKSLGKLTETPTTAGQVLPALLPVLNDKDPDVRRVAATSAKKALDKADKAAHDYARWVRDYVDGLGKLLENKGDASERLWASRALGDLGPDTPCVPTTLLKLSTDDPETDVKATAAYAIERIKKSAAPKKADQ